MESKLLIFVFCLMMPGVLLAQKDSVKSQKFIITDMGTIPKNSMPLIVLDNEVVRKIKKIDTSTVLNIAILKTPEAMAIYGSAAKYGAVLITTKQYAIKSYQKKLNAFSKEYKDYLERPKDADKNFFAVGSVYYINGKELFDGAKETIFQLYQLKVDNIKSLMLEVELDGNYFGATKDYKIIITTKN